MCCNAFGAAVDRLLSERMRNVPLLANDCMPFFVKISDPSGRTLAHNVQAGGTEFGVTVAPNLGSPDHSSKTNVQVGDPKIGTTSEGHISVSKTKVARLTK